jgi:hypothetical protein
MSVTGCGTGCVCVCVCVCVWGLSVPALIWHGARAIGTAHMDRARCTACAPRSGISDMCTDSTESGSNRSRHIDLDKSICIALCGCIVQSCCACRDMYHG